MAQLRCQDDVTIYYEVTGQGRPIVFVHEFAGSCKAWGLQVAAFSRYAQTVTYNCRGYPPSSVPNRTEPYGQGISVTDLGYLLDHLDLKDIALVGLSMGGNIALTYTLSNPERITHLIVGATGGGSDDPEEFSENFEAVAERLERQGPGVLAEEYLSTSARIQLKRKSPERWRELCREFSQLSATGLANTIRRVILARPPIYALQASLEKLDVPTLVLAGDEDSRVLAPSRFIAGSVVRGQLKVFPNTGHTINLEEPEAFNRAVCEFLLE